MTSTLGYGLVLAALALAISGAIVGIATGFMRREVALPWVRRCVYGFSACMVGTNLLMAYALLAHDFSVKYVAQVGSRATPALYTVVSLWSALEGSILFWGAVMGTYLFAFAFTYRKEKGTAMLLSMGVMLAVGVFFAFLIAGPANPWTHIPFPADDGPGPNPLLQNHPLMIIHPPMLYCGFVGMTVPFGIACGALLKGELTATWMVPLRRWTLIPWVFLSTGIILGGWWAYAVLGWGGYWAWDPVENASLLPWLAATAFMHSTLVLERKRMLKLWTLSLALGSFVLTIIGTFMTRSGVFNSVHSFTQSEIGPTFLVFIAVLFVFCLVLLAARGPLLLAESSVSSPFTREGSILLNNLAFVALTFAVLLGTTFPIVVEALQNKRISVGEPYFNRMTLPMWLLVLFLMGVGPMLPWGEPDARTLRKQLLLPGIAGLIVPLACFVLGLRGAMPLLAFATAAFVTVATLRELLLPARARMAERKESLWVAALRSASRAPRRTGGYLIHLGVVMAAIAIAASSAYKSHSTGTVSLGQSLAAGRYQVRFDGLSTGSEPHRKWTAANITILGKGTEETLVGKDAPRMNFYERSTDPVGSPAVHSKLFEDVYVSLLSFDPQTNSASFNAWVFPLVGWIWWSMPVLVLGTLVALWPQRRRAE